MSQAVNTPPTSGASVKPAGDYRMPTLPSYVRIFRWLTSMRVALVLLFGLALLTLAGTMIAQVPADVKSDPQAYATWLDGVRPKYGGWTNVLEKLGFFAIFSSIWFTGILVLLCSSVLACSARRAPRLWRTAARPKMIMTKAFFERAPHRERILSKADPDTALTELRAAFKSHHFRTAIARDGDDIQVCADRFRWGPFGRIIAHVSFVIVILGAFIGATQGFRNEAFSVPVGATVDVGNGTGMAVKAKSFSDSYYPSGEPREYASQLVLYKDGAPVKSQKVIVNHPMRYEGVSFYQSFFGAAPVLQVANADGKELFNEGVPLLYDSKDGKERIGQFTIPEKDITVFVVAPASGEVNPRIAAGQTQLEVYKTGSEQPIAIRVISQGKPTKLAGLDFTFVRERQFTGLIVASDPGTNIVWIGSTLLVLGMCMVFFFPHRRVRAVVRPTDGGSETCVAAIRRRDEAFAAQFQFLVDDIELAVTRAGPNQMKEA